MDAGDAEWFQFADEVEEPHGMRRRFDAPPFMTYGFG